MGTTPFLVPKQATQLLGTTHVKPMKLPRDTSAGLVDVLDGNARKRLLKSLIEAQETIVCCPKRLV